jgi:hypothetical protein
MTLSAFMLYWSIQAIAWLRHQSRRDDRLTGMNLLFALLWPLFLVMWACMHAASSRFADRELWRRK